MNNDLIQSLIFEAKRNTALAMITDGSEKQRHLQAVSALLDVVGNMLKTPPTPSTIAHKRF
jgi:hypothetical protein